MLELNEDFNALEIRNKRTVRYNMYYDPNITRVKCEFCELIFVLFSEKFHAHLLFRHGFYLPTCGSKKRRRLEINLIQGMKVRSGIQIQRRNFRSTKRIPRMQLWNYRIRHFFTGIENNINITYGDHLYTKH